MVVQRQNGLDFRVPPETRVTQGALEAQGGGGRGVRAGGQQQEEQGGSVSEDHAGIMAEGRPRSTRRGQALEALIKRQEGEDDEDNEPDDEETVNQALARSEEEFNKFQSMDIDRLGFVSFFLVFYDITR